MKSKVKSSGTGAFAKGGSTKMFGKQSAGPQVPGNAATGGRAGGGKFAVGGKTKMAGKGSAKPQTPGQTRG